MNDEVRRHCDQIDRCNQRGGRMLSVVDLNEAGTLTPELAAWSLAAVGAGASFLVGARPGGAGKTTVMGALLNFVPRSVALRPADGLEAIRRGSAPADGPRCCYVCHEIGSGPYYAYLWGRQLREYFRLPGAGHMLATNLHADTFDQARQQICRENAVPASDLRRMNLMYFLAVGRAGGRTRRRVVELWAGDGQSDHRRVWADDGGPDGPDEAGGLVCPERLAAARRAIADLLARGVRTIEQVRTALLASDALGAGP